ncbi:FadR/GntR family transcriptional regulator [Nocardioides sp. CFH 31398]|uniref:FadR/GntR family transcriptional regulator n=1 Tax=Nocardioides sp. CFH 31398 TaxID=2919579 RepID=UPI001F06C6D3|nr:FCD domain-containing protein [Nocardioides sp. CFH 31398]MCH1868147.1 FCD domain-containing protein [Nocardioides sp. CFH 31398]
MTRPDGPLQEGVLDALGLRIASGGLAAGTVLTLESIDAEYGVSRSVSREAVRVLAAMGLVTTRRRVGVTVCERSAWQVFDPRLIRWRLAGPDRAAQLRSLTELRAGFEPTAAALAAGRATTAQGRRLAEAALDMAEHGATGDLGAYLAADQVFHRTLLEAAGNEMLTALADVVDEVLAGRTRHDLMPARPNPEAIALHEAVARAVRVGDARAAEDAVRGIIAEAAAATSG